MKIFTYSPFNRFKNIKRKQTYCPGWSVFNLKIWFVFVTLVMHPANLSAAYFSFCLFVFFSFFMALFPFQRTNSTNWWTVGRRVRLNHHSLNHLSFFQSTPSFLPDHLSDIYIYILFCSQYIYIYAFKRQV